MNLPIDKSSTPGLVLAVFFGFIFGFLLDRGRVDRYEVIVNFFRFRDFTMLKIMLAAIVVGGIGVGILNAAEMVTLHIKDLSLGGLLIGGAVFGVGMVLLGYCPGTGIAAIGTGSVHGVIGFLGMIVGAIAYGVSYPWWKAHVLVLGDFGKVRLVDSGVPAVVCWIIILGIAAAILRGPVRKIERGR